VKLRRRHLPSAPVRQEHVHLSRPAAKLVDHDSCGRPAAIAPDLTQDALGVSLVSTRVHLDVVCVAGLAGADPRRQRLPVRARPRQEDGDRGDCQHAEERHATDP